MTDHPITPSPELVEQWRAAASNVPASLSADPGGRRDYIDYIAIQAARWGSDQELEACMEWLSDHNWRSIKPALRDARRPKPPTLAKQALLALYAISTGTDNTSEFYQDIETVQVALKRLQELENN